MKSKFKSHQSINKPSNQVLQVTTTNNERSFLCSLMVAEISHAYTNTEHVSSCLDFNFEDRSSYEAAEQEKKENTRGSISYIRSLIFA